MQVRVVQGGSQAFRALVNQAPSQQLLGYLENNVQRAATVLGGVADSFAQTTASMYHNFNNSALMNAGKALINAVGMHAGEETIYPLTMDNMGTANTIMRTYIMAHPKVSVMNSKNYLHGFQDTYYDMEPGTVGEDRYDYQRVVTGSLIAEKEDEEYLLTYSNDDIAEDLATMDKISITDTWDAVAALLMDNIDPTDPDMNEL